LGHSVDVKVVSEKPQAVLVCFLRHCLERAVDKVSTEQAIVYHGLAKQYMDMIDKDEES